MLPTRRLTAVLLTLLLAAASAARISAQAATPVPHLDQTLYNGAYYEIARLPSKSEKNCITNALHLVAPGDKSNSFLYVDSCRDKNGYVNTRNYGGRTDKSLTGAVRIPHLFIFHRPRYVLATAPDYSWIMEGTPNHKSLWLYSKTPIISEEVLATIRSRATAQGFNLEKLTSTPQHTR